MLPSNIPRPDLIRLRHMLEAAREAVAFGAGRTTAELSSERMRLLAVVRCIEIIGEAASKVSPEIRAAFAEIPWADIVAMRNRLIHAYFDVDGDRVRDTIVDDLPPLIVSLERIVGSVTL